MKEKSQGITLPKEEKSKDIPELSDEEINKASKKDYYFPVQSYAFIEGAKWYREQLKQRQ